MKSSWITSAISEEIIPESSTTLFWPDGDAKQGKRRSTTSVHVAKIAYESSDPVAMPTRKTVMDIVVPDEVLVRLVVSADAVVKHLQRLRGGCAQARDGRDPSSYASNVSVCVVGKPRAFAGAVIHRAISAGCKHT